MVVASAKKRSTRVNLLPQGGMAFLLDPQGVKLSELVSEVHMSGSPYNAYFSKPVSGSGCTIFFSISTTNMNGFPPFFPIRSAHGQFESVSAAVNDAAAMTVCED
jgi:hypothetical protein